MVRENHLAAFKKKNQFVGFHVQDPRFGNHTHQIVTASSGGFSPFETFFPAKKGHSKRKKIYAVLFGIVLLGVGIYLAVHFVNLSSASDNFPPQTTPPESEKAIWVNISESSFTVLKSEYYEIPFSRNDQIFALSKLSASDQVYLPAGRSYDGSNWEPVYPILLPFNCGSDSCKVRIPQGNEIFAITSTKASVRSDDAIVSDFLIQSTFGPTRAPIQSFPRSGNFYDRARLFLIDQMNKPATLLRAYYRQKVNALIEADSHPGRIRGPCEVGSRWFSLAFTRLDSKQEFRLDGNKLFVNGLLRTELSSNLFNLSQIFQGSSGPFYFCVIYSAQAAVGAQIPFRTASGSCDSPGYFSHPEIYFSSPEPEGISVIHRNAQFTLLNPSVQGTALLRAPSSNCIDPKHFNLFAKDGSSVWYRFQPRLVLLNNTLSNPTFESSLIPGWDPTAPKDFLNENDCKPRSVQKQFNFLDESITLNTTNLEKLSALSNSPVFYVDGLNTATPPCQAKTARFLRSKGLCSIPSSLSSANMILGLIQAADNGNIVIDVNITSGSLCSDLPAMVQIQASSECWKHVHSDYFSVYDFTQYLYEHPGGPDRIRNSANSKLQFPHPVSIWEENKAKLEYIGTYGSQIRFTSFPKKFLKYEIALNFNALVFVPGNSYGEFCGSIGEINNDPVVGDRFFIHHNYSYAFDGVYSGYLDDSNYSYTPRSKSKVWSNVVLKSEDQVRQRAAWALSQIFVINIGNIPLSTTFSESWLKYYDIFVRNAFSNYFDIMKEVSYNPMMGMMLSYFQSVSFQRNMEKDGKPIYPDENYARELMQLFSIGLWKLNKNGTRITDSSGRNLETYNNRNIQSFARIWTGFRPNKGRGNIELPYPHNMIDLMVISPEDHDTFPKEGLDGSFIGDQYPLCSRLPKLSFSRLERNTDF
jgi:cullin-associated NEDD8-dissociated protein 1